MDVEASILVLPNCARETREGDVTVQCLTKEERVPSHRTVTGVRRVDELTDIKDLAGGTQSRLGLPATAAKTTVLVAAAVLLPVFSYVLLTGAGWLEPRATCPRVTPP